MPRRAMFIDSVTKNILLHKLNFTPNVLSALSGNIELSAKTLGLLEIIKNQNLTKRKRKVAITQLQQIKKTLSKSQSARSRIQKDYEKHYSFFF